MKITIAILWLLTAALLPAAESISPTPTNAPEVDPFSGPPGRLLDVMRGTDKTSLVIYYEFAGRTNEQTVLLMKDIAAYHFCSWVSGRGVALALSDTEGDIYWAAGYFARLNKPLFPRKIRSPSGYNLLGIANTGGDTIVVAAIDHHDESTPHGWMYINTCPPAWNVFARAPTNAPPSQIQMSGFDHLREFAIPKKQSVANFHKLYNDGKLADIYSAGQSKFMSATTEKQFLEFMGAVQRKLGKVTQTTNAGFNV